MNPPRALLVVLVLTALAVVTSTGARLGGERGEPSPPAVRGASPRHHVPVAPVAVLDAWDVRRAAAWSRGDLRGLRSLYVAGSAAGRADVRMLRAWVGRGLRVRAMRMQVLDALLVTRTEDRIVLDVTDRLAHAVAHPGAARPGVGVPLPRDAVSRRTVTLRRVAGEWRVAGVQERGQPAR